MSTAESAGAADPGIGEVFVVLADSLKTGHDVIDTMDVLVQACTTFTTATEAGIVLADAHGALHVVASTSERTTDVEEEQLGTIEGPCWDSFRSGEAIEVADSPHQRPVARVRGRRGSTRVQSRPRRPTAVTGRDPRFDEPVLRQSRAAE